MNTFPCSKFKVKRTWHGNKRVRLHIHARSCMDMTSRSFATRSFADSAYLLDTVPYMSALKKQRVQFNEWNLYISMCIFEMVGVLTSCKAVSKRFLPPNTITMLGFREKTPLKMMMQILSHRTGIRSMDFTSSFVVDESVLDVICLMHPDLEFICLDNCRLFSNFPLPPNPTTSPHLKLNKSGVIKWPNGLHISLKGCWEVFEPSHLQRPTNISMIVKNAIFENSVESIEKAKMFLINPNHWNRTIPLVLQEQFKICEKYRIIKEAIHGEYAYVLMDVVPYSLVVWIFRTKTVNGKKRWELIVIWRVSIEIMWRILKNYWSS